ncbi:LicD family protein [Aliarcobacter skirrowii]|uniref:nucleoside-diphosphate sugar epimerase/dehydratase n=1 Tax=Aliarcobacter skirrowii TaxID=28200 RepID=UPI0029AFA80F|nr:LicD family protein [Aliarcobacter skirrowii]MDX4071139.1 LicD family protein [Aliarcobacter skirrowii]
MKKVLLFGAGSGAINFIENEKNNIEILACIDNDKNKHGKRILDIEIISPEKIENFEFDEIIITTQWAIEVENQLINNYLINKEKIIHPLKNLLKKSDKPFEDEKTLNLAKKIITFLCGKAKEKNIPLHIDYGTLLGIVRDGKLIPWDDDIDLAIISTKAKEVESFILENIDLIDNDLIWTVEKIVDKNNNPFELSLKFNSLSNKFKTFDISIAYKGIIGENAVKLTSLGQWYTPKHHVLKLETLFWENTTLFVPSDFEKYLEFTYGSWKTPKQEMKIDEGCQGIVTFEDLKDAKLSKIIIL